MSSKGKQSAPAAPDPAATANAQAGLNKDTAITNAKLARQVSYSGPYGAVQYVRTDDGTKPYEEGAFDQRVTLTPEGTALQGQEMALDKQMNQIALDQTGRVASTLSQPVDFGNGQIEDAIYDPYRQRLDSRFANEEDALRTRLANQGITSGSEAFNNEFQNFGQTKNDAYGTTVANARAQAVQEALARRNQPINEIGALMSGQQLNVPQFMPQQSPQVAGTDIIGPTNAAYQGQLANWQAQQQRQAGMMGGLASLGGSLGSAAFNKWG